VRVLVVDDSAYQRLVLSAALRSNPLVTEVETAADGKTAIRRILDGSYDLMTLDVEMPEIDGLTVLRWAMANRPLPVLVVTSLSQEKVALAALEAGAFEVLRKPGASAPARTDWKRRLARSVAEARQLRLEALTRHALREDRRGSARGLDPAAATAPGSAHGLVAVAASTGGPAALRELFSAFRRRQVAVGVAQHLPAPFTRTLAGRLAASTGWDAREAVNGERALPGTILVAPAGHHMEFAGERDAPVVRVHRARGDDRWVPSADLLLQSAAAVAGPGAVGVVLTGMGSDGTGGARAVAASGGLVLAESAETAVIPGMPASAAEASGAALFPLGALARELDRRFPLATLSRFHE
jgi:two-component system, chemotaxis family, protein-glutamate methylesterase/glutaminase